VPADAALDDVFLPSPAGGRRAPVELIIAALYKGG
jgi:hypothetical protein